MVSAQSDIDDIINPVPKLSGDAGVRASCLASHRCPRAAIRVLKGRSTSRCLRICIVLTLLVVHRSDVTSQRKMIGIVSASSSHQAIRRWVTAGSRRATLGRRMMSVRPEEVKQVKEGDAPRE